MKYKPAQEGWLSNLFGFGKKKTEPIQEDSSDDVYFGLSDYVVDDILDFMKKMTDEDIDAILSKKLTKVYKPQDLIQTYRSVLSKNIDACCKQLMPKWKAIDKFGWTGEQNDPVDWSTKTIKIPALAKAMQDAGKVASAITVKPEFNKMIDWTNDDSSLVSGTMAELGYNKNLIKEMIKFTCLVLDERNQDKLDLYYVTAEDHRSGWNFAVNHVFWKYYHGPESWPDLQAGEKVFLAVSLMCDKLARQLSKFIVRIAEQGKFGLI